MRRRLLATGNLVSSKSRLGKRMGSEVGGQHIHRTKAKEMVVAESAARVA